MTSNSSIFETVETVESIKQRFKNLYPINLWKDHGWFEEEYLDLINIHWLQFSPPSEAAHYTLAILYTSVAICGFIGNVMVIFMFFKCRSLRTPANILVVNLAISDFLMIAKTPLFIYNSVYLGPATGQIGCKIYGFVGGITGTVSIGTLAAIAFDRYSVVVYPLEPLRNITKMRAKISVVMVWIYGCFFASIPALDIGLGRYVPEGYLTSCSFDYLSEDRKHKIFIFAFFCAAWLLPLAIISFCYINILRIVIKARSMGKNFGNISSRHCKEQEKRKTELKLTGVVIGVIALFFAAWTPYSIVALLGITGHKKLIFPITSMIPAIFCKVASCIDPFVYIVTHPKFREECKNLLISKKELRRRRSTFRSRMSSNRYNHQNLEISCCDEVEVLEMSKISLSKDLERFSNKDTTPINTISLRTHVKGSPLASLPRTIEENTRLQPPSWYAKPKFVKNGRSIRFP